MKSSLGGSMLLYIVIFFVGAVIMLFASILSYSKAYRVKNRIVEIIESNEGYTETIAKEQINPALKEMGYQSVNRVTCDFSDTSCTNLNDNYGYNYCVCAKNQGSGKIYEVITYVRFEFPIIGDVLTFPVRSQSRILGRNYNYD